MELLKVDQIEEALEKLAAYAGGKEAGQGLSMETEKVSILGSFGRVLAENVTSEEMVPGFSRSTVDGYAVQALDTGGASESLPVFLTVVGEVEMGEAASMRLHPGECVYVPTGGMVPDGADACVMVEYCEPFGAGQMAVYDSVAKGKNMVMTGDDIRKGQIVLRRGRKVRPEDMGALSSIGKTEVLVYRPWKVTILSTGDEIIDPSGTPEAGQVRDVNTYGLCGEALAYGFEIIGYEVVRDEEDVLREKVHRAMESSDLVILSGGSSQGKKDATARIIGELASSGVLTHGLAVKPGKPTILGYDGPSRTALIGLPGHPVAALLLFRQVAGGLWERMTGMEQAVKKAKTEGILMSNVAASPGRKTYQLVKMDENRVFPVFGKSGLIRTMSEADGYIVLDVNDEGVNRGEQVTIYLL